MESILDDHTLWFIVFSDTDVADYPFKWALKKGFRHCWCFRPIGADLLYVVNPNMSYIESQIIKIYCLKTYINQLRITGAIVVSYKQKVDLSSKSTKIGLMNCVGITKQFIGLQALIITPYQLYKRILKNENTSKAKKILS